MSTVPKLLAIQLKEVDFFKHWNQQAASFLTRKFLVSQIHVQMPEYT